MKVSEMITSLKHMEEVYGDIEVEILIQNQDGLHQMDKQVFFVYSQYEDDVNKCSIQDFPY
jgi:hypothetical protein